MSNHKQISDVELMKLLVDPRRTRILELAEQTPMTVSQMAEQLGELTSRVYYHVHKLEEAGLLKLVETRQHGNLLEKYYRCTSRNISLKLDPAFLKKNLSSVARELDRVLTPGLELLNYKLSQKEEKGAEASSDIRARLTVTWEKMSESEWSEKFERVLGTSNPVEVPDASTDENTHHRTKDNYVFIVLGYNLDDAERLGFYTPPGDDVPETE